MSVTRVALYVRNANSKINQELTEYIDKNITQIVMKAMIVFDFRKVNLGDPITKKINKFPTMIFPGQNPITGIPLIRRFIQSRMVAPAPPLRMKTEEEDLHDMMFRTINEGVKKNGDKLVAPTEKEEDAGEYLADRARQETEKRKISTNPNQSAPARDDFDEPQQRRPHRTANLNPGPGGGGIRDNPQDILENMPITDEHSAKDNELMRNLFMNMDDSIAY